MAKWSDLPLELKEMVVDAVAAQAPYSEEDDVHLVGPLILLERATSERAASHLWRKVELNGDTFRWSRVSVLAADIAPRRGHLVESADLGVYSWPREPSAIAEMVEHFGKALSMFTSLKFLTVSGNLALITAVAANLALSARNHLKSLSVEKNLAGGCCDLEALAGLLHCLSSLEVLRLCGIDSENIVDLGCAIQSLPSLHTLVLRPSPNLIFDTTRTWSSSLQSLFIDDADLPLPQLAHLLENHGNTLTTLSLQLRLPPPSLPLATFSNLAELDLFSDLAEGLDFPALFACFKTSPLVALRITIYTTQVAASIVVDELMQFARMRKGGLKSLELDLNVEEATRADEEAMERLRSLEGDIVENVYPMLYLDAP